jgi:uncharacterized LabA/DUF88 family protein
MVYVDGFNLYYGLKAGYGRKYHWLDLQLLASSLLRPGQELRAVHYFTARAFNNSESEGRQVTYLDALASHSPKVRLIEGRFQEKPQGCLNCGARWTAYEEKETDVNIAIALLEDAVLDAYDVAFIISGDSDLRPAVAAVKRVNPGKKVIAAFPPRRHSKDLAQAVDAYVSISTTKVRNAQLPPKIVTAAGIILERPAHWS